MIPMCRAHQGTTVTIKEKGRHEQAPGPHTT